MISKHSLYCFLAGVLILLLTGCNFPTVNQAPPSNDLNTASMPEEPENLTAPDSALAEEPALSAIALPAFNIADPCSILPASVVETALGQPADPIVGPDTCLYSNGTASISVGILQGDVAKNSLASQILQLEDGCSMSFSFSSDQPDPTPLPPEADPLLALTLPELMERSLTLQQGCGGPAFETLSEYGPGVYLTPFELFLPGGQVTIVSSDYTLTILYTDMNMDAAAAVEMARQIIAQVATGE
jgi:hypothetical protein